jgi:CBS domain containing-hemolysin-like protein
MMATSGIPGHGVDPAPTNPERFLATVQVGIRVIGTTAGAFGGSTLALHLIPLFQAIEWLRPYAKEVAVELMVASILYLSIVVGELVPKPLAMRIPTLYRRVSATPLLWLSRVSSPTVRLRGASSNLLLKVFGDHTSFTEARLSTEEIHHRVEDAAKVGSLHPRGRFHRQSCPRVQRPDGGRCHGPAPYDRFGASGCQPRGPFERSTATWDWIWKTTQAGPR